MSTRAATALALAAALLLGACGGDDDDAAGDTTASEASDTSAPSGDGSSDDELVDPPAGGDTNGEPVDVCGLLSPAEVSEIVGTEFTSEPAAATGSLLGQCDYTATDFTAASVGIISVSARPASEYDATVEVAEGQPVEGFDVDANDTAAGLMLEFDDFMIVIFALGAQGNDTAIETAIGQAIAEEL
jgi:hypothetical protein